MNIQEFNELPEEQKILVLKGIEIPEDKPDVICVTKRFYIKDDLEDWISNLVAEELQMEGCLIPHEEAAKIMERISEIVGDPDSPSVSIEAGEKFEVEDGSIITKDGHEIDIYDFPENSYDCI